MPYEYDEEEPKGKRHVDPKVHQRLIRENTIYPKKHTKRSLGLIQKKANKAAALRKKMK